MVQIKLRAQMSAQMLNAGAMVKKLAVPVAAFKEAGAERREGQE